jgi:glycosyltransferase involved in cell wall biosynthesis
MKKIKVLILSDGLNWIVDRITDKMISDIPCDFTKRYYTEISSREFVDLANKHDIVHYQNWDLIYHLDVLDQIKKPFLLTIRSHRYPEYLKGILHKFSKIHTITPWLKEEFPESVYIPDGIFDDFFEKKNFVVGFAGRPDEYKGYFIIKQACEELGVVFKPATGEIPPEKMFEYYESIDLYACASIAEGHSTPVMECLAMNKPVITTDVGMPKLLNVFKIDRSVEGVKRGILNFYTRPQVEKYSWKNVNKEFHDLYMDMIL